jgi:hypothetical protein
MKKGLYLIIFALYILSFSRTEGQDLKKNSSVTGTCYAGHQVKNIYIPPPEEFMKKSGKANPADIVVYYSGFSSRAITAFEYAVSIIESILPADTRMTIVASFEKISVANVLGNSVITDVKGGWEIDALDPYAIYPVALGEKISGKQLNTDAEGDLILRINSSMPWYYGTDGKPGSGSYDLVTVVLHEICHGLGFYDSMGVDGSNGYYGAAFFPMIYDKFVTDIQGKRLTDTLNYKNDSPALKQKLTEGPIYFNGPVSGSGNVLFTPSTFDDGSSISHLDESTYSEKNTSNPLYRLDALMTPYIDYGEAIHNPGPLVRKILGDIGWINTRFIHTPVSDTEERLQQVQLSVQIKSDTSYNRDLVGAVFSYDGFKSSDTSYMTRGAAGNFTTTVQIPAYNTDLQYYFFVKDYFSRIYRSPSMIDHKKYTAYVGTDTVKPVIIHTPVNYSLQTDDTISFYVDAADNIKMDSVYLEYKINDGVPVSIGMKYMSGFRYKSFIEPQKLNLNGGDIISYRIFARDSAKTANTAVLPKKDYFVFRVEEILSVVEGYSTDFRNAEADFFCTGFTVSKPAGFANFGLHTKHPYESPEIVNGSLNYTAILRHPVKYNNSGLLITYDEIVLVEPGEPGSLFGSSDFYDYVVLEGSANGGKSWFALEDGYDSRFNAEWESAYKSTIIGDNSTFTGTEELLRKHMVYFKSSDKIAEGNSLLLRFRLFSDPYAHGWGWVIENLKLNPLVDAVEKTEKIDINKLYPNPGKGIIHIQTPVYGKSATYHVYNSSGICISHDRMSEDAETVIDISGYAPGLYIVVVSGNQGIRTFRYSLVK